jgi:hypothetical protein
MRQRQRQDDRPPNGGGGDPGGGGLDHLREQANRFLAAGDEAINSALADSDSETFLRANRQAGGE